MRLIDGMDTLLLVYDGGQRYFFEVERLYNYMFLQSRAFLSESKRAMRSSFGHFIYSFLRHFVSIMFNLRHAQAKIVEDSPSFFEKYYVSEWSDRRIYADFWLCRHDPDSRDHNMILNATSSQ